MLPALKPDHRSPPVIATGMELFVVEPLPSWPELFSPQQYVTPISVQAHVWLPPATTKINVRPLKTGTGTVLFVVVPLPSWPELLSPQQ